MQLTRSLALFSKAINQEFYLYGYQQKFISRRLRKMIAGTELHRAWLAGNMGVFIENDPQTLTEVRCGVLQRAWYTNRKLDKTVSEGR